jgi:hypothetical protein
MSYGTFSEEGGVNYGHQSDFTVSEVTTNSWVRHPQKIWTSEGAIVAEELIGENFW